ncbi:argininosuccinate lyase [Legionella shakespearei]|uniref:Argininosuccinate lyase n=1 Tax=Legionella shakespearei DSM 23087 TaxID=1122169 RepID=A0A0W0Z7S6_9GAMM|nr:argininosuccinate lyase [Legionella shakespearei]KTD65157.1 argininosuccinate lyase [Legionella shakespearei DSM 23087]
MTNKTWGGRFKKALDSQVNQFNSSLSFDYVLFEQDIKGSQAHVQQLAKQHIITEDEGQTIYLALEEIRNEIKANQYDFKVNQEEDIHMFIEQLLIQKLGDLGKKLHTGRSRNDQVALDLRLYTLDKAHWINELLIKLIGCLDELTNNHQDDLMPGYTHLQQAQPITLGNYFNAYQSMFERDKNRLEDWFKRSNYSPLGAGALAGSKLPLDRKWVAKTLGFTGIIPNTLDAVSDRDFVIEFCSVCAMTMMHLSRLCEDLILWSTQEFNFLTLDDAFATGSSLMPNKKNPDVPELIRGKTGRVYGHLMSILTVMKGLPLAYNKDMQEDKEGLFDTVNTVVACLQIITPFLQSLTFNTELMKIKAQSGYLDATAMLESLVIKGMSFRDAHHQVGLWILEAMEKQCSLTDLLKGDET